MPATVQCNGERYGLVHVFKHDFFAATGLYRGPRGDAVLKLGRKNDIGVIPGEWIGAFLARRELRHYRLMQDLPGVPGLIGAVGEHGLLHEYIPGRPLERHAGISDSFFDELLEMLETMHDRRLAYVDLNKPQNILLGDDGKPYLIDFQISLHAPPAGWRGLWPVQWILKRFQQGDRYHYLKHKRRMRPDLLSELERGEAGRIGLWIRLHRLFARPITKLRRRILKRLARSETVSVSGSSAK